MQDLGQISMGRRISQVRWERMKLPLIARPRVLRHKCGKKRACRPSTAICQPCT